MSEPLSSPQNPRVKRIVKLRSRRTRDQERAFLIEGYRELLRASECALPVAEIYYCPELYLGENEDALVNALTDRCGARATEVTRAVFEKMAYRDRPEGLLAVAPMPEWSLQQLNLKEDALIVIACAIEKPGNLGTILRTSDAVGADAVIVCDRCTDVFNPNVVRASIGTLFTVPVAEATSEEVFAWLQANGVRTVATSPDAQLDYTVADLTGRTAIVLGSEQYGLNDEWLARTDEQVMIPMRGRADSLNVAMATAVVLFEAHRQRRS